MMPLLSYVAWLFVGSSVLYFLLNSFSCFYEAQKERTVGNLDLFVGNGEVRAKACQYRSFGFIISFFKPNVSVASEVKGLFGELYPFQDLAIEKAANFVP